MINQRWKNSQKNDSYNNSLSNLKETTLNSEPTDDNHATTKPYVDSVSGNKTNKRDLSLVMNHQGIETNDNNLPEITTLSKHVYTTSDKQAAEAKYVDDNIGKGTLVTFKTTLENFLKVTVSDSVYKLRKNIRESIMDTTVIMYQNSGVYLLQQMNIKCNDKTNSGKLRNFIKSTEKVVQQET